MTNQSDIKKAVKNNVLLSNLADDETSTFDRLIPSGATKKIRHSLLASSAASSLLLALAVFLVYWPSLKSDFVYDARIEIIEEDFVTSLSNLPEVLSFQVLCRDDLMLAQRPGQMLYLMINAVIWGRNPFGYHLSSNLLHAANVALIFVLLHRLVRYERDVLSKISSLKIRLATIAASLIFALHPICVESVAEVSYSSSLLVTFFTLITLIAATAFKPEHIRSAIIIGSIGTLSAFAAVTCKESGVTACLILIVYWLLFKRKESKSAWLLFLGAATALTMAFLAARFLLAPPSPDHLGYLGGSFSQTILIQPRLWVFMMGKLVWPAQFSGDYVLQDVLASVIFMPLACLVLVIVGLCQAWLAVRSRIGALGVAIYWLGLATVSNLVPLYHPLADRYYYLPMVGLAMQFFALFLIVSQLRFVFLSAVGTILLAILPLTILTCIRQDAFANSLAFWSETLRVSPSSFAAAKGVADELVCNYNLDAAIIYFNQAIELNPQFADAYSNRGFAHYMNGQSQEALNDFYTSLEIGTGQVDDYSRLYIWLIEAAMPNQMVAANEELKSYLNNHPEKNNTFTSQEGLFLIGELSQSDLLKAADSTDKRKAEKKHCEAFFYIGMKQALNGDLVSARSFMHQCIDTNIRDYTEYQSAQVWLKRNSSRQNNHQ